MKNAVLALLSLLSFARLGPASAEEVLLAPHYRPGDSYSLSLGATTNTETASKKRDESFREDVRLHYAATVVVLDADAAGRPTRERHEGVRLTYERPDGAGSLFRDGATLEVRRGRDGDVEVFAAGERVARKVEAIVARLLQSQFEYTLGPALFAPGRSVAVGESWQLDARLARRFLRERGVRVVELGEPATATLERRGSGDDAELVVRFAIPIDWFELDGLPVNARASRSDARFEGTIRLASGAHEKPAIYSSRLALRMNGIVTSAGLANAVPWTLARRTLSDQRTLRMASREIADAAGY